MKMICYILSLHPKSIFVSMCMWILLNNWLAPSYLIIVVDCRFVVDFNPEGLYFVCNSLDFDFAHINATMMRSYGPLWFLINFAQFLCVQRLDSLRSMLLSFPYFFSNQKHYTIHNRSLRPPGIECKFNQLLITICFFLFLWLIHRQSSMAPAKRRFLCFHVKLKRCWWTVWSLQGCKHPIPW